MVIIHLVIYYHKIRENYNPEIPGFEPLNPGISGLEKDQDPGMQSLMEITQTTYLERESKICKMAAIMQTGSRHISAFVYQYGKYMTGSTRVTH